MLKECMTAFVFQAESQTGYLFYLVFWPSHVPASELDEAGGAHSHC